MTIIVTDNTLVSRMEDYTHNSHSVSRLKAYIVLVKMYFSITDLVKKMKVRISRLLQQEFPTLGKVALGAAFLGDWIWSLQYREQTRWDGNLVSKSPSR